MAGIWVLPIIVLAAAAVLAQPASAAPRGKGQIKAAGKTHGAVLGHEAGTGGRRTSMRLEPAMWDALEEICQRENLPRNELCGNIDNFRKASSLTAAVRVFIATYFRAAATEEGHASIGHGTLYK